MSEKAKFPTFMDAYYRYPVGSPEWSGRISASLCYDFETLESRNIKRLIQELMVALPGRPWNAWPPEAPWQHRETWCQSIFGISWNQVVGMIEEIDPDAGRELRVLAGDEDAKAIRAGNPTGANQHTEEGGNHNDVMNSSGGARQGNSSDYLMRRLQNAGDGRGRVNGKPVSEEQRQVVLEAIEKYQTGELESVRAAAKFAGLVREATPLDILRKGWKKASPEERAAFLREVA